MNNDDDHVSDELIFAKAKFEELFGSTRNIQAAVTPASLILLGDHTHYNEGILISVALNRFTVIIIRKRSDNQIIIADLNSGTKINLDNNGNDTPYNTVFKYVVSITKLFQSEKMIGKGFECAVSYNIPDCIGLGFSSSLQVCMATALKKVFNINIDGKELLALVRKNDLAVTGKISNLAHLYTTKFKKENRLFFIDLRTLEYKTILPKDNNFELIILDTGEKIINPQATCNERIEECEIGVKGLRLYIWGIKNLRDVQSDFLLKHYHMLPRRIFNRVLYNVGERARAENAIKHLKKNSMCDFGKCLTESHRSLSNEYELSCFKCDFIVEKSIEYKGVYGSKMISCTPKRGIFNLVNKSDSDNYINYIKHQYKEKFSEDLTVYSFRISKGIKEISSKEIESILK